MPAKFPPQVGQNTSAQGRHSSGLVQLIASSHHSSPYTLYLMHVLVEVMLSEVVCVSVTLVFVDDEVEVVSVVVAVCVSVGVELLVV
jgi:hypothetical protein